MNMTEEHTITEDKLVRSLSLLGRLCLYPTGEFEELSKAAEACLPPEAANRFELFRNAMAELSHDTREELYTATFEVTPAAVPYVSIHLFGEENFKRGELMAALNVRYHETGFSPATELPDHIGNLLQFAATVTETERMELVEYCLLGPISKMSAGLRETNPYRALIETISVTLSAAYPGMTAALSPMEQARKAGFNDMPGQPGCAGCSHAFSASPQLQPAQPELV